MSLLRGQWAFLFKNKWHALGCALLTSIAPQTIWLSVTIIALITLRRGWQDGGWLMAPVMVVNLTVNLLNTTPTFALFNAVLLFVPCYLAAYLLRALESWQAVAWFFIMLVVLMAVIVQNMMPDFVLAQYQYFLKVLRELDPNGPLIGYIDHKPGMNQMIIASYCLGIQAVSLILSSLFSLLLARSIQSRLFYPGEFRQEMLRFRADKLGLLLLTLLVIAAWQQSLMAMSILPLLVFYFLLAGLSLSLNLMTKQKLKYSALILMVPLLFVPFIMLPVFVIFGSLDSLFNFRLYLPSKAAKTL